MLALLLFLIILAILFGGGFAWASVHFLIWVAVIFLVVCFCVSLFGGYRGPRGFWW